MPSDDPRDLEGADVRGDPHVDEPEGPDNYWQPVRDQIHFRFTNLPDTLVSLFLIIWGIDVIIAIVILIVLVGKL